MRVDYLIIGAGIAGITLKHFLKNERTVILDPNPGGYKVGESFIPETFHHPEMQTLLPGIRALPSYSTKIGTAFVSMKSVASFPLPIEGQEFSAHVARSELESFMLKHWDIPVIKERVRQIDHGTKVVHTDQCTYEVERQILDCSGPGMVVARALGEVTEFRPAFATWTYFDVVENNDSKFWDFIRDTKRQYSRYNITQRRILPGTEEDDWSPAHTTILTQLDSNMWTWQIPLYNAELLSFGVVSREAKVTADTLFDVAEKSHLPHYTLRRRLQDGSSPYNRVHTRNCFANRADVAATKDYILVGDACAFADPVYSVGGGMAVNKAIEVAALLNDGGWTQEKCERWCQDFERIFDRSLNAFDLWYSGDLLTDESAAGDVQDNFLMGNCFQVGIATHYADVVEDTTLSDFLDADRNTGCERLSREETSSRVAALLGVTDEATLAGWTFSDAISIADGLQHRWQREGLPELIVTTKFSPDVTQYYRRVGDITLSFMNLWDRPYPLDDHGRALFDALEAAIRSQPDEWMALKP
jgi:flavin-dependent dehydrogenase